jgi:arsenite methyltransferase
VAGALTERDFVAKLSRAGFGEIEIRERRTMSVDDAALYPLFTDDLLELMRTLIPPERQGELATAVVVTARPGGLPAAAPG